MFLAGMPDEAHPLINKAMRLSPYPPIWYRNIETNINYLTGRYDAAITSGKKVLDRTLEGVLARDTWVLLIASYSELGREAEARVEAKNYLEHDPNYSLKEDAQRRKDFIYKDKSWIDRYINSLRKAGLPE